MSARPLTTSAVVKCSHQGTVQLTASQSIMTIDGAVVLVLGDLIGKPITGCQQVVTSSTAKCTATVSMLAGASTVDTIGARAVLLDTATGITNSVPPGTFSVESAGHTRVTEK